MPRNANGDGDDCGDARDPDCDGGVCDFNCDATRSPAREEGKDDGDDADEQANKDEEDDYTLEFK